jgi:HAD superfamily hydrolase (TIGR01509 family)
LTLARSITSVTGGLLQGFEPAAVAGFRGHGAIRARESQGPGTILAHRVGSGQSEAARGVTQEVRLAIELPRPDGLIFDLDGTLVDTVRARIDGWVEALASAGIEANAERIGPMIGMDGRRLAREVARAGGRELSDDETETIDRAAGEAFDRRNTAPAPLPGVRAMLAAIESCGARWVIATSSRAEQVRGSVASLGFEAAPTIVDGSHVQHAKPAPDLLLLAGERLEIAPERCWAIGDSTWDVRAAVAAGMTPLGVTAGSAVDADALTGAGAALVVETLTELAGMLETTCRE